MKELVQLLPLVAVLGLVYLLMIRPAARRNKAQAQLQGGLQPGDRVMLTSGFFGTVTGLDDDRLDLELADGVVVSVARGAVARLVSTQTDDAPDEGSTHDPSAQES